MKKNRLFNTVLIIVALAGIAYWVKLMYFAPIMSWHELRAMDEAGLEMSCGELTSLTDIGTFQALEKQNRYSFENCREAIVLHDEEQCETIADLMMDKMLGKRTIIYSGMEHDRLLCSGALKAKMDSMQTQYKISPVSGSMLGAQFPKLGFYFYQQDLRQVGELEPLGEGLYRLPIVYFDSRKKADKAMELYFSGVQEAMKAEREFKEMSSRALRAKK